jgi:hypothetical protein
MEKKLIDNVWETRQCRINSEKRLKRLSFELNLLAFLNATYIAAISIWALLHPSQTLSIIITAASLFVTILSVFVWGLHLDERAAQFKATYIALQRLYEEHKYDQEAPESNTYIREKYTGLLSICENHSHSDYIKLKWSQKNKDRSKGETTVVSISRMEQASYIAGLVLHFSLVWILGIATVPAIFLYAVLN